MSHKGPCPPLPPRTTLETEAAAAAARASFALTLMLSRLTRAVRAEATEPCRHARIEAAAFAPTGPFLGSETAGERFYGTHTPANFNSSPLDTKYITMRSSVSRCFGSSGRLGKAKALSPCSWSPNWTGNPPAPFPAVGFHPAATIAGVAAHCWTPPL